MHGAWLSSFPFVKRSSALGVTQWFACDNMDLQTALSSVAVQNAFADKTSVPNPPASQAPPVTRPPPVAQAPVWTATEASGSRTLKLKLSSR